jgi:hypothetical protein
MMWPLTARPDDWLSCDHLDKVCQFFAVIEIDPLTGRVQMRQAPIFLALNPNQVFGF